MATPTQKRFKWTGFSGKTLWDWLNLLATLLIPIVVVGATIGFGWWQVHLADVQHQQDQASALDQQRAVVLQTYIDNIQDLLLNHHLLISKPTDDVAILARARTLSALQGLDPSRKGSLVQFIYEAQLIVVSGSKNNRHGPIIDLSFANLNDADLSGADLSYADLSYADLSEVHLSYADLSYADLSEVHLGGADLSYAHLSRVTFSDADFSYADLSYADLSGADLSGAKNLTQQQLDQVFTCKGAILPQGLTCHRNQ